jgi:stearoyl-CoA desaturase (delta-9 desaturase)
MPLPTHCDPLPHAAGEVRLSAAKLAWNGGFLLAALATPVLFPDPVPALATGLGTALILCFGHSAGFHRGVIHGAYRMGPWTERVLVYLLVLTGIGGPIALMRMHNTRDRHQNTPAAPNFYTFAHSMWDDFRWYLFHDHTGTPAPIDPAREADPFYRFMERTWRWQQVPWAILLSYAGGPAWLMWGVAVRIAICVLGHWYVNWACHTHGYFRYRMPGSGEEGRNHLIWGALAMGEGWHNNHHAYPQSARFGIGWWELDPGWWAVCAMRALGLVWDVKTWEQGAPLRNTAVPVALDGIHEAVEALLPAKHEGA